jgi:hypothetical protein
VAKTIARITGTAIVPGISRNGRLYTKEMIKSAVDRAQQRLGEGTAPMTMLTHHLAGDDSIKIVGQVNRWSVDGNGAARFEAALADTPHARTIAALADPNDGDAFLQNVSIRGGWLGVVKHKMVEGTLAEYGEDLELDGLDFTKSPGVIGAKIDSLTYTGSPSESDNRTLIYETVTEARVEITEDIGEKAAALKSGGAATSQTKAKNYADPGYQPDKMKRYALDTKAQAKAAWSYINQAKNATNYTAAQLKRIKERIRAALGKFGVKIDAKEGWLVSPAAAVTEGLDVWPSEPGSFEVRISNGMVTICVSSWQVDPADLELCARAAMEGACQALATIDPDTDGDIDIDGGGTDENASTPGVTETDPESTQETGTEDEETGTVADQPTTPAADAPQTTAPTETPAVPAAEAPAPVAVPNVTLTGDQFAELMKRMGAVQIAPPPAAVAERPASELVGAGAPVESAPAAPAAPAPAAPAPVAETTEQMVARLVAEGIKAGLPLAVQEAAQAGGTPSRKGLVTQVSESAAGAVATEEGEYPESWPKDETGEPMPAHKLTNEQWKRASRPTIEQAVMGNRSVYRDN